jgi:ABC-2 type transport system permease protein
MNAAIILRETRAEFLNVLRQPAFALPTLLFPVIFYVFFGLVFSMSRSVHMPTWLLATFGTLGVMAPALFGFGVGIAVEKGEGWLRLKRVAPVSPFVPLAARALMAMIFAFLVFAILATLASLFGDVALPRMQWLLLAATLTLGALPFCAMGLAGGLWLNARAAPAIVNLVYLPMAMLSGLWIPLPAFPDWLQPVAPALPPYHLAAIALDAVGAQPATAIPFHIGMLAAFTAAFLAIAAWGWRRARER